MKSGVGAVACFAMRESLPRTPAARRAAGSEPRSERFRPELLTPEQAAGADRAAGVPLDRLMENAGRAVARSIRCRWRPRPTLVLVGPGNNGGDGWVAARLLAQEGWPVAVAALAPPSAGPAAAAAARWRGPVVPFAAAEAGRARLVVDAVFGAGLSRPLNDSVAAVLAASGGPILAVDVPSGLDGATGQPRGKVSPAAATVTFVRRKPGHLLLPGRALCGEVECHDIGLPDAVLAGLGLDCFANGPALWRVPVPDAATHKHARGHVVVAAGPSMPGAARLAAAAARRAGAGMVTLAATSPGAAFLLRGTAEAGLIVADPPAQALLAGGRERGWVLGPGLAADERTGELLRAVLDSGLPVVVDAGGLTACAGDPAALRGAAILTPHAGEFARVFGPPGEDRPAALRAAAQETGAVVVLKGSDTVIASPDGRVAINANAPPSLATAGTGDVLSGIAAAFLSQGLPAFEAACAAVWVHGAAAPTGPGVVAEDVIAGIPRAMAEALA
ncbi:NAD(P)H-hydrate dehydratase [Roseomonas sp. OT10]|uniref:NAD(P)H-hydrate dehydratase n=1 Tax=Roseomonas cutis TaxID=2897332 RepID=UPI001E52EC62|nr:NAD(P)H-hydrate dehydratase [Roseomonas sp. OT10]UFN46843.1 NAD(P)H-hydrate dehydratase [Roseomonas sp. OT10]